MAVVAVLVAGCSSNSLPTLPSGDVDAFAARLDQLRSGTGIPGMAVAVAEGDQIIWEGNFGFADRENEVLPTTRTSFHLASLTKPFASLVLMRLVEEGRVDLEDPVADYGVNVGAQGVVRVKHLLTHTSDGIPGERFRYNGDRYALLDQVMLRASGRSFAELLVEGVIRPLGLAQTAPNVQSPGDFQLTGYDRTAFSANLARGYTTGGDSREAYPPSFSSAAGLLSSVADMVRFSAALDQNELVPARVTEQVFTPSRSNSGERLPYGLGWFIQDYDGIRLVWHYGFWVGNSSLIVKVPERNLTFVVLANSDMLSRPYGLGADENVLKSPYAAAFIDVFVN